MSKEKKKKHRIRIEKRDRRDKPNPTHKKDFEKLIERSVSYDPKERKTSS